MTRIPSTENAENLLQFVNKHRAPKLPDDYYQLLTVAYAKKALKYASKLHEEDFELLQHAYLPEYISTFEEISTLLQEFDDIINTISDKNLSFPISIASSFDYSDRSEIAARDILIEMCNKRLLKKV